MSTTTLAILLAAGEGTRMNSAQPKVLRKIAARSLIGHACRNILAAETTELAVVLGPDRADVAAEVRRHAPDAAIFEQSARRGTAHAALQAAPALGRAFEAVLVLFGDTPLLRAETIRLLVDAVTRGEAGVAVLGFEAEDPAGFGRLIVSDGQLAAIVEHKDASEAERAITLCNGGMMAFRGDLALNLLEAVRSDNGQGEFYLTDCVALARKGGHRVGLVQVSEEEALGVNDRAQLARCEAVLQQRMRRQHLRNGVSLIAPETVFFAADTQIARDVVIEPHVVFGPNVSIGEGAVIHAFSHLEGAEIGKNATIGPFARLRPGSTLGERSKIGNFVEIKNAEVASGAKISHLSYIGDATIGAEANIGAGTITCNYDGFNKFQTEIGAGAFIGSNSALIAPVRVGAGAYIGSGSVVTHDVPDHALAIARAEPVIKPGWAENFRARAENQTSKRK